MLLDYSVYMAKCIPQENRSPITSPVHSADSSPTAVKKVKFKLRSLHCSLPLCVMGFFLFGLWCLGKGTSSIKWLCSFWLSPFSVRTDVLLIFTDLHNVNSGGDSKAGVTLVLVSA